MSYAHAPLHSGAKLAEVTVAVHSLDLLNGQYTATDKMMLTVKPAGNHLIVMAGGSTFEPYPTGPDNFAMRSRDIKVNFTADVYRKGQGLVVTERGR